LSSREFSSELVPDPALQRLLLVAAYFNLILGAIIILPLPVHALLRMVGALCWCFMAGREIRDISYSHKRYSRLRVLADGRVELQDSDDSWKSGTIGRNSVVLPRLAWLNLRLADGGRYRALLRGDAGNNEQWRRLQVICRHLGPKP